MPATDKPAFGLSEGEYIHPACRISKQKVVHLICVDQPQCFGFALLCFLILKRFDPHAFINAEILEDLLEVCFKALSQVFIDYDGECNPNLKINSAAKLR